MSYLNSLVLDQGLQTIVGSDRRLDICRLEPTTYAQATATYTLANKTGLTVGAVAAMSSPAGRKVTVPAITDGTVTATSTGTSDDAEFWALTDPANSRLLAAGPLSEAKLVVSGNIFTLPAFDIGLPLPA